MKEVSIEWPQTLSQRNDSCLDSRFSLGLIQRTKCGVFAPRLLIRAPMEILNCVPTVAGRRLTLRLRLPGGGCGWGAYNDWWRLICNSMLERVKYIGCAMMNFVVYAIWHFWQFKEGDRSSHPQGRVSWGGGGQTGTWRWKGLCPASRYSWTRNHQRSKSPSQHSVLSWRREGWRPSKYV